MPRVTFTATDIVWIDIRGHKPDESHANRDAGDLIDRLQAYLESMKLHPLRAPLGMASPGSYRYGFHRPVASQVIAWLKANGAAEGHTTGTGET